MKCLWCGEETDGYFCVGGGNTNYPSNTGERTMTKSYCYDSFLTQFKASVKHKFPLVKEENEYLLWKDQIKEWYAGIPLVFEKTKKVVTDEN